MKIAILTLSLDTNYGGILQCYALQTVLRSMGYEVQVLTRPQYERTYYIIYPLALCKRLFKRFVLGKKIAIFKAPHQIIRQPGEYGLLKLLLALMQSSLVAIRCGVLCTISR